MEILKRLKVDAFLKSDCRLLFNDIAIFIHDSFCVEIGVTIEYLHFDSLRFKISHCVAIVNNF